MGRIYSRDAIAEIDAEDDDDADIETWQRGRPQMMRGPAHISSEAAIAREDIRAVVPEAKWISPTNLDAPEPRKGFVQRWVSDGNAVPGQPVAREWQRKMREGWRPRDPETISMQQRIIYPSSKTASGEDVIRVGGLVLCEIPVTVAHQRKLAVDDTIKRQRQAIPESVQDLQRRARAKGLSGEVDVTDESNTFTGRRTATMT